MKLTPQSLFDPVHLEHKYVELVEAGENMHRILDVTPLQQSHLEKLTHAWPSEIKVIDEVPQWTYYGISSILSHTYRSLQACMVISAHIMFPRGSNCCNTIWL